MAEHLKAMLLPVLASAIILAVLVALFEVGIRDLPPVRTALEGAAPAALGAALAGLFRLEQRVVTNRQLGFVFLSALAIGYLLGRTLLAVPLSGPVGLLAPQGWQGQALRLGLLFLVALYLWRFGV